MGYTHYWTFKAPKRGTTKSVNAKFEQAVKACQTLIYNYNNTRTDETRLAGYTAHTKPKHYGGINFNGTGRWSCENFLVFEKYKKNVGFQSCKTNRESYDVVVVACLCILKHYLGDNIEVSSDGDSRDWCLGLDLARKATGLKSIEMPKSIRVRIAAIG